MLPEDDKLITKGENGGGGGEQSSHLAQNQDTKNKINQSSKGCEEEKKIFNCLYSKARSLAHKQELEWHI